MSRPNKYTNNDLLRIAKQYNTLQEFRKDKPSIYQALIRRSLLDEAKKHLTVQKVHYDYEMMEEALPNFNNLNEIKYHSKGLYNFIYRNGLQEEAVKMMKYNKRLRSDVVYCWRLDKNIVKFGVTSSWMGHDRIYSVANKHGVENPEILFYEKILYPFGVESELLKIGAPVKEMTGDGHTEFRRVGYEDLQKIRFVFTQRGVLLNVSEVL